MKSIKLIFSFFLLWNVSYAQPTFFIDSLETLIDSTIKDTTQLKILSDLSVEYMNINPDKAFKYGNKALYLSNELKDEEKIAESYYNLGIVQFHFGNYDLALDNFTKSLGLREKLELKTEIFECLNSIGVVYRNKGDYIKAAEYSFKALEKSEELGNKQDKAFVKGNLAIIFDLQGKSDLALQYFMESLDIFKELGNQNKVSATLANIGNVYLHKEQYDFAIDYYLRSLIIREELQDKRQIAISQGNIAVAYHNQKKFSKALEYFNSSLKTYKEMGDRMEIARSFNNIGSTHLEQKKYSLAEDFLNKSLKLAKEIDAKELIKTNYQNFSELYSTTHDFEKALDYFRLYVEIKELTENEEISGQIAEIQSKYEIEKKEKKILLLEKERIEQEFQIKRRTVVIYLVLLSVLILLLLFVLFVRHSKIKRNSLKEKQTLLKEKLISKERELTSTVTYMANKNNILSETKEELKELLNIINESTTRFKLKSVVSKIDDNLNFYEDWQNFKNQFDEIYPEYINRLLKKYPNISHNDLKLCVYLKMGISNKEIAQLQSMTLDGVKSANKRLKKKMEIPADVSLVDFVRQF